MWTVRCFGAGVFFSLWKESEESRIEKRQLKMSLWYHPAWFFRKVEQVAMRKRVFSGMRPTGRLHLGHLVGALENWVSMQDEYECIFGIVDWHALTSEYQNVDEIKQFVTDIAIDWLAVGLDPEKSTLMIQSMVPEHAELHLALLHVHSGSLAGARAHLQGADSTVEGRRISPRTGSWDIRFYRRPIF